MILCVTLLMCYILFVQDGQDEKEKLLDPEYIDKVFNTDRVNEIDITVDEGDWADLLENASKKEYIMGDITINGETFPSVGIRAKGNSSLKMVASDDTTDRYSLKIDFHEYIKSQTYYGLEKLALNNCISDYTYMKEYLSYELFSKTGIPTPACSYANIKINGEEWGLYLAVEVIEESFIERYFGSVDGNLYKPESTDAGGANKVFPNDIKGGTNLVYNGDELSNYYGIFDNAVFNSTSKRDNYKVIEMMKNLSQGTNLEEYIDVDEVLRYFAVNTFLVNLDSYAGNLKHNYYLYEREGIFQILPWDLNLAFGGFQVQSGEAAINFPIDTPVSGDTMENSPLISKLLEVDEYREKYHGYLRQIVTEYIDSGEYEATIDKVDSLIKDYVKNDPTAFYTYEQYENAIPVLKQFGKDRAKSIIAQIEGEQPSTSYGSISTTVDLSLLGGQGGGKDGKGREGKPTMNIMPGDMQKGDLPEDVMPKGEPPEGLSEWVWPEQEKPPEGFLDSDVQDRNLPEDNKDLEEIQKNATIGAPPFDGGFKDGEGPGMKRNMPGKGWPYGAFKKHGTDRQTLIVLGVSVLVLLIALVFVLKFKRRKYI